MKEKNVTSRIIHKHDVAENWTKAINFIPKEGEIIVYDPDINYDYARIKIGDGITPINSLPFITDDIKSLIDTLVGDTSVSEQINAAVEGLGGVGEDVAGQEFTIDEATVVAAQGAEIFNDYETNIATGDFSHAEGNMTIASGPVSHAEGYNTLASGTISHAEGGQTKATHPYAHAEGDNTKAFNVAAHAEGSNTTASGLFAHTEGVGTIASEMSAHAEGNSTTASGLFAHAEGNNSVASSSAAHAEGNGAKASGFASHAEGIWTEAAGEAQHVQGKYNIVDNTYVHIVGNGTAEDARSNAHTIDWEGNAWFAGDVYLGGTGQDDTTAKKLITEDEVSGTYATIAYSDANLGTAKSYTNTKIADLINSAPTTLDTLGEIATAMQENASVVEALEGAIGNKQATITGGATTITSSNLTANRALISNSSGKVAISAVTSTELGYLDGVTSAIQTQLNNKVNTSTLNNYYTKTEIDNYEFITIADIDAICGTTIQVASNEGVVF